MMRIATGEEPETIPLDPRDQSAVALGIKGGRARAAKLSAAKRKAIAKKGAKARWG